MTYRLQKTICLTLTLALLGGCSAHTTRRTLVLSGNENKIDLTTGTQKAIPNPEPDSLSILDFSTFPPKVTTLANIPNSVVGPPSNIAISPDGKIALVANSLRMDPAAATGWTPENFVHILDLTATPPKLIGRVTTDLQPSGISFSPDGRLALVANRASGTVSVLAVEGVTVKQVQTVKVCEPADMVSDVAISPDGHTALASVQKAGYLAVLKIDAGKVTATGRKVSVYGQPYRCVITPDGKLALTAGAGSGNGLDQDALSVIDMKNPDQPRTTSYVPLGNIPESFEISPDGNLVAAVVMEGSNVGAENPIHSSAGAVTILKRTGNTYLPIQHLPVGRIPEGVAFTADGRYLLVQCHPDRTIWIFRVTHGHVQDTGTRINMPGMPSSIRAVPLTK